MLDRVLAAGPADTLGLFFKVDQPPSVWLAIELTELRFGRPTRLAASKTETSSSTKRPYKPSTTDTSLHYPLANFPCTKYNTPSLSLHTSLLVAVIKTQSLAEQWTVIFPLETAKQNVVFTVPNNIVLLKIV